MAHKNNHLVIMAGGVGSRFWPMSTVDKPKQFIDVLGTGRTLLQLTFDRFEGVCDPENVWVVTNKSMQPWFTSSCLRFLRVIFCRNHAEETQLLASPISVGESRKRILMQISLYLLLIISLPMRTNSEE